MTVARVVGEYAITAAISEGVGRRWDLPKWHGLKSYALSLPIAVCLNYSLNSVPLIQNSWIAWTAAHSISVTAQGLAMLWVANRAKIDFPPNVDGENYCANRCTTALLSTLFIWITGLAISQFYQQ